MTRKISADNILALIARVRTTSRDRTSRIDPLESLYNHLCQYRLILAVGAKGTISQVAIYNWFYKKPRAMPGHRDSKRFLNGYLEWLAEESWSFDQRQRPLLLALRQYLEPFGLPERKEVVKGGATASWTETDSDTLMQFKALEGVYQFIRPHSSLQDQVVLEALAIVINEGSRTAEVQMYSHNQRSPRFLYQGEFYASYNYGYSLVRRAHEKNLTRFALRCLTFFVNSQREGQNYIPQPGLSGLVERGVEGKSGPIRMIASPFIALKAPGAVPSLDQADFSNCKGDLRRLHEKHDIVVGKVAKPSPLFRFCDRLFVKLKPQLIKGLVLQTVSSETLASAVGSKAVNSESLFFHWSDAVKNHISG
jgi:hypothetical protein